MNKLNLGRSGVEAPQIGLGCRAGVAVIVRLSVADDHEDFHL